MTMSRRYGEAAFAQLLLSGTWVHEGNFADLQQQYGVYLHPTVVMVVSIDRYPDLAEKQPLEWRVDVGRKLVDTVSATTQSLGLPYLRLWTEEGVMALFIDTGKADATNPTVPLMAVQLVTIARRLQKNLSERGISVSIGIGSEYADPGLLYRSFQEAMQSMTGRFFQGNELIFEYHADSLEHERWTDALADEKTEFLALLRMGDEQGTDAAIRALFDKMASSSGYNEKLFRSEAIDLVMLMSRSVFESGVSAVDVLAENAKVIHELYLTIRYDKFVQKACRFARWLALQVNQSQTAAVSFVVRQAIEYLKQHHRERVTLDEVARHCCVSKYHLSHLFKQEVGVGVIDFLNQMRLEKAIFYLHSSDWSVQQIAGQVGYADANYFSRLFRQRTGCSPSEYRSARLC
jgi:two-component system, response regulator YesN